MNGLDALSLMCSTYPGGREAIALRLGKPDETLRKELCGASGFKLHVPHALRIVEMCREAKTEHRLALVNVFNAAANCVALPMPEIDTDSASADVVQALRALGTAAVEFGAFVTTAAATLDDEKVTSNELLEVHRKLLAMMAHQQRVVQLLEAIHRKGIPFHSER